MGADTQTVSVRGIGIQLFYDLEDHDASSPFKIREHGGDILAVGTAHFDTMLRYAAAYRSEREEPAEKSLGVFRIYRVQKDVVKWFGYEAKSRGIKPAVALKYLLWWITGDPVFDRLLTEFIASDKGQGAACN